VSEWTEEIVSDSILGSPGRVLRGGSWNFGAGTMDSVGAIINPPAGEYTFVGIRVASLVPEPARMLLELTSVLTLSAARWRARGSPRTAISSVDR
jgi:hypothetical protein